MATALRRKRHVVVEEGTARQVRTVVQADANPRMLHAAPKATTVPVVHFAVLVEHVLQTAENAARMERSATVV
jgi:hypothetical protein